MKRSFYVGILVMSTAGFAAAHCPEGHLSCEEAARMNAAANTMGILTGMTPTVVYTCEPVVS